MDYENGFIVFINLIFERREHGVRNPYHFYMARSSFMPELSLVRHKARNDEQLLRMVLP